MAGEGDQGRVIHKSEAEVAVNQRKQEYAQLIGEMKERGARQGDWFFRLGGNDGEVLLLKQPAIVGDEDGVERSIYVAVTLDGPMRLASLENKVSREQVEGLSPQEIKDAVGADVEGRTTDAYIEATPDGLKITPRSRGDPFIDPGAPSPEMLRMSFTGNFERGALDKAVVVESAMKNSMEAESSGDRLRIAQEDTAIARTLRGMLPTS